MSDGLIGGGHWPARMPDYGRRQHKSSRRYLGLAIAAVLHVLLIYALVNGLATKVVHIAQRPIEARIIEPVKPPPPPPPLKPVLKVVSRPRIAPPPPFVPPPEVHVQASPAPTITHQDAPAPSEPVPQAPPATVAKPVSHEVGVACPNSDEVRSSITYPQDAQDNDITGNVTIEFTVDADGHVVNERVAKSANVILDRAAFNAVKQFRCIGQGEAVRVQVPFTFNLN